MGQGAEREYVLQLAVFPDGLQTSELYPLWPPRAQAVWPLEGTPGAPPGMTGSMLLLCGAGATCLGLLSSPHKTARTHHLSAGDPMLMDLCSAIRETACWLWAPCRSSEGRGLGDAGLVAAPFPWVTRLRAKIRCLCLAITLLGLVSLPLSKVTSVGPLTHASWASSPAPRQLTSGSIEQLIPLQYLEPETLAMAF